MSMAGMFHIWKVVHMGLSFFFGPGIWTAWAS